MLTDGSPPLLTNPMSNLSSETSNCAQKWQNSTQRSLQNSPEREARRTTKRKMPRRRKRRNQRKRKKQNLPQTPEMDLHCQPKRKTLWMNCRPVLSTWRNGRDFILTMTRTTASNGSGNISTQKTIPFGREITNTTTNSLWSSCLVILSEVC